MPEPMSEAINEALYALLTDKKILRDFFAGCALMGILPDEGVSPVGILDYAEESYAIADALLAAREGKSDG